MLGVIPFSVELLHVLFASFDPQCGKSPDHFQIQEVFVTTVYGLSTIQLDLFQMIIFFFFWTLFILLFLYNSHSVFFIAVFLWLVNQWTVVSGRLCSNLKGAASPSRPETGRAKHRVLACPDPIRPECSCSWPHYREGLAPSSWFHDPPPSLYTLSLNSLQRETRRMVKAL